MKMPVLFVGHGSPLNAIEENAFSRTWRRLGRELPEPKAILSVSAHWETHGTRVTAMQQPRTIHDFSGFPDELFAAAYPAPGSTALAERVQALVRTQAVQPDLTWGLDHGTWSVLLQMFPDPRVPVVQLSLDHYKDPGFHFALAKELAPLRDEGVLILGSGNIVHNLHLASFGLAGGLDWAEEFDRFARDVIESRNFDSLVHYEDLGRSAQYSIPTNEHFLPLLYVLALVAPDEGIRFFNEQVVLGSISMRGLVAGN